MPETIRIAAVDDHPLVRGGLERALQKVKDIKLIALGKNAADACRIAEENKPDVMANSSSSASTSGRRV